MMHYRVWREAKEKLARMGDVKMVMIVGSYGKTTARAYIERMVRHSYIVATPPGNINTETGVATWIAQSLPTNTTLLVLEADAYAPGDIARMCDIAQPHVAVITALGDQHMSRLGTRETLVRATAEVFTHAHETATLVARSDVWDTLRSTQTAHASGRPAAGAPEPLYGGRIELNADEVPRDYAACEETLIALPHTLRSAALLALAVGYALHVPSRFALAALTESAPPARRQEVTRLRAGDVEYDALDDSYNISLTTALAAITRARTEAGRLRKKLLVVVAGIPEALDSSSDNVKLALACLEQAEHTVVIDSMFTPHFSAVFAREKEKCTVLPSVKNSVLLELPTRFHPDEWFVLLFNELGDTYH
jgi:UDP-N-acetylmuramoyl-tripeptide--D-alanyl-D-alanine ligase